MTRDIELQLRGTDQKLRRRNFPSRVSHWLIEKWYLDTLQMSKGIISVPPRTALPFQNNQMIIKVESSWNVQKSTHPLIHIHTHRCVHTNDTISPALGLGFRKACANTLCFFMFYRSKKREQIYYSWGEVFKKLARIRQSFLKYLFGLTL